MNSNGSIKPNFISLDWVIQAEEALEVAKYLNFGGRIGSGQVCLDDSHCATEACNKMLSLCQCKECDANLLGSESCLGCEADQYCASVENNLNECSISAATISIAPTGMPVKKPTISPTANPSSALPTSMPVKATVSPTTRHPTTTPSDSPSVTLLRTSMPVEATISPTTSSPTAPPSFASPTAMPMDATVSPTTASPPGSPSVSSRTAMPVEATISPIAASQSPTTEPTVTVNATTLSPAAPTTATTQMPTVPGIQTQANIANENSASAMFATLLGKKLLLIGILGQVLLI